MRRQLRVVKSGDELEARALAALLVEDLLRIIEAAAALRLAAQSRIGRFGRARAFACRSANFFFADDVAGTDDHDRYVMLLRHIRNYIRVRGLIERAAMYAIGIPTRQMWAKSCVAIDKVLGGSGVPKRSGTTSQFMMK